MGIVGILEASHLTDWGIVHRMRITGKDSPVDHAEDVSQAILNKEVVLDH
jgi:hypothetical protein